MSIMRCMRGDRHKVHVERTCMWEDAGKGTAMDPHAGMVWWRGEGRHGEGEGVGEEYKVGGMGTAMHVGRPMGHKQVENEKKTGQKRKKGEENTYCTLQM